MAIVGLENAGRTHLKTGPCTVGSQAEAVNLPAREPQQIQPDPTSLLPPTVSIVDSSLPMIPGKSTTLP